MKLIRAHLSLVNLVPKIALIEAPDLEIFFQSHKVWNLLHKWVKHCGLKSTFLVSLDVIHQIYLWECLENWIEEIDGEEESEKKVINKYTHTQEREEENHIVVVSVSWENCKME